MYIVTWIEEGDIRNRVYSKREYAENLMKSCEKHNYKYKLSEETVDREIVNPNDVSIIGVDYASGDSKTSYYNTSNL